MTNFLRIFVFIALCAAPSLYADEPLPPFSHGAPFGSSGKFVHTDGATMYRAVCQACHMPDARGAKGAGEYPALAADPKLAARLFPIARVLAGYGGMPSFADNMTDEQVASVVNYVRTHFDNHYTDTVTAADVAHLRAAPPTDEGHP
ncbi:MAG TPA: cytochrome c [Rudaea sp.]|jgi:mono/diheme cytochrome c family protein|nr:cytochrome c [Rudaea sp.]